MKKRVAVVVVVVVAVATVSVATVWLLVTHQPASGIGQRRSDGGSVATLLYGLLHYFIACYMFDRLLHECGTCYILNACYMRNRLLHVCPVATWGYDGKKFPRK